VGKLRARAKPPHQAEAALPEWTKSSFVDAAENWLNKIRDVPKRDWTPDETL
jgi:hypothetical protein